MRDCTGCNHNDHIGLIDTAAARLHNTLVDCSYKYIPFKRKGLSKPTIAG